MTEGASGNSHGVCTKDVHKVHEGSSLCHLILA